MSKQATLEHKSSLREFMNVRAPWLLATTKDDYRFIKRNMKRSSTLKYTFTLPGGECIELLKGTSTWSISVHLASPMYLGFLKAFNISFKKRKTFSLELPGGLHHLFLFLWIMGERPILKKNITSPYTRVSWCFFIRQFFSGISYASSEVSCK